MTTIQKEASICCFISPHGFGHASRTCAILGAIRKTNPNVTLHIFTKVPEWFFKDTLGDNFHYHLCNSDIGIVQDSPLSENLAKTVDLLGTYIPFHEKDYSTLILLIQSIHPNLLLCDISPLGLFIADKLGIPSFLIENFTWDWIYEGYVNVEPGFRPFLPLFKELFQLATYHIQTIPVCLPHSQAHLVTAPVARLPRNNSPSVREKLAVPKDAKLVMISMGGIEADYSPLLANISKCKEAFFVIPGGNNKQLFSGNLRLLPHHSSFYHPDLVFSSDLIIGKTGYSTLAETFHAGLPFLFVSRPCFRESPILAEYILEQIGGEEITTIDLLSEILLEKVLGWVNVPKKNRGDRLVNGAEQAASFIQQYLR